MAQKLRFQRPLGERRYKKLFVVSVEGSKTEPQYFAIFNQPQSIVLVKCLIPFQKNKDIFQLRESSRE